MIMQDEREQNTHGKGVQVKIPLLPNNVGKKSVNNSGPTYSIFMSFLKGTNAPLQLTIYFF